MGNQGHEDVLCLPRIPTKIETGRHRITKEGRKKKEKQDGRKQATSVAGAFPLRLF